MRLIAIFIALISLSGCKTLDTLTKNTVGDDNTTSLSKSDPWDDKEIDINGITLGMTLDEVRKILPNIKSRKRHEITGKFIGYTGVYVENDNDKEYRVEMRFRRDKTLFSLSEKTTLIGRLDFLKIEKNILERFGKSDNYRKVTQTFQGTPMKQFMCWTNSKLIRNSSYERERRYRRSGYKMIGEYVSDPYPKLYCGSRDDGIMVHAAIRQGYKLPGMDQKGKIEVNVVDTK